MMKACKTGLSTKRPRSVDPPIQIKSRTNLLTFPLEEQTMGVPPKAFRFQSQSRNTWQRLGERVGKLEASSASKLCLPRSGGKSHKRQLKLDGRRRKMSWIQRAKLYKKIEDRRQHPLLAYVTSKRPGIVAHMATDALAYVIKQLDALPDGTKHLDFLIASNGGDPMVAWRVLTLMRERLGENGEVSVLVPQSAYSAATLLAFGANHIVMHPNGHLGPVDMQITTYDEAGFPRQFSTEEVTAFLDFVRDNLRITDQQHLRALFEMTCKEVTTLGIGFTARSSKLAVDLGQHLLQMHMKGEEAGAKARLIVENLSKKFQHHGYPVSRTEALDLGLPVNKERDVDLEKLMWEVWLNFEDELQENDPFEPILELMKSTQAKKLLAPVPQLAMPRGLTGNLNYQTSIEDANKASKIKIDPVDFEYTNANVESLRFGYAQKTKGKILSCRMPDMIIRHNTITTARTWERFEEPKKETVQS